MIWLALLLLQAPTASPDREGMSLKEIGVIVGAVATPLLAGLGILWKELQTTKDEQKKNYSELKADHANCEETQKTLALGMERMKGRDEGVIAVATKLETMMNQMLSKIEGKRGGS